jgi:4-carboxymuconolactone decarboxylase
MGRLKNLDPAAISGYQKELYDRIAAQRGAVRGPFNAWLYSPELCDRVEALGAYVRFTSDIPMLLKEIAVLQIARAYTSQYMWRAHVKFALDNGVSREIVDAIRDRHPVPLRDDAERLVHRYTDELLRDHRVSDAAWQGWVAMFDERRAVEFTAFIGNFCMVAMALNTFEVDLPKGDEPLLPV